MQSKRFAVGYSSHYVFRIFIVEIDKWIFTKVIMKTVIEQMRQTKFSEWTVWFGGFFFTTWRFDWHSTHLNLRMNVYCVRYHGYVYKCCARIFHLSAPKQWTKSSVLLSVCVFVLFYELWFAIEYSDNINPETIPFGRSCSFVACDLPKE